MFWAVLVCELVVNEPDGPRELTGIFYMSLDLVFYR